jgi:hypothetical protein
MCLAPKMPEVKVPVPAAAAAPPAPPPDMSTAYDQKRKPSSEKDKARSGKKALRYNPEDTAQVAGAKSNSGLQIKA